MFDKVLYMLLIQMFRSNNQLSGSIWNIALKRVKDRA